jgi:CheY-like chemotaxis protein
MEVLDIIKNNPKIRHIPVHVMSAAEEAESALHHGAIGYLQKPTSLKQLGEVFNKFEEMLSGKIRNLLIVEDNPEQQISIKTLIGNGDVQSIIVSTGAEALQVLADQQVDCMILDLSLPDMSGFEVLKKLNEQKNDTIPPIIIYSAQDLTREEVDALNYYTSSIIIKGAHSPDRLLDEASLFLHRVVSKLPEKKQQMINALYEPDQAYRDKKILLTDDDMRNVFAISKILEDKGMQVYKAANGQKALDLLAAEPEIDLVLMDIMMPVMDGIEAIQKIREQKQFSSLPIIALTAKAMAADRENCIEAGASDYMSKPVDINQLLSLMRVWLYRT